MSLIPRLCTPSLSTKAEGSWPRWPKCPTLEKTMAAGIIIATIPFLLKTDPPVLNMLENKELSVIFVIAIRKIVLLDGLYKKDYRETALHAMGLASFLFIPRPYGPLASVVLGFLPQVITYANSKFSAKEFMNKETACKVLDISLEQAGNQKLIEERYKKMINELSKRQVKASEPLKKEFQNMINDVTHAYNNLTQLITP